MEKRITPLTEGGLLAALTVVIALLAVYVPVVGFFAVLFWPLPLAVLVLRHGLRQGVMALFVSGAALAMLIEPMLSARLTLGYGPLGLVLGYGYRHSFGAVRLFLSGLAAATVGELMAFGLLFAFIGENPFTLFFETFTESVEASTALYAQAGMGEAEIETAKAEMLAGLHMAERMAPLILALLALLNTVAAYFLGGRVISRLGHSVPELPPFSRWRLPRFFALLFGFAMVGLYFGSTRELEMLYVVSLNLNMLALFAGLIQGLSLVAALLNRFGVHGFLRSVLYLVLLLNGLFAQILAFAGLFDMLFDYRRRFSQREGRSE